MPAGALITEVLKHSFFRIPETCVSDLSPVLPSGEFGLVFDGRNEQLEAILCCLMVNESVSSNLDMSTNPTACNTGSSGDR